MNLTETFVRSHPASPGQKPTPNLRMIGTEDAARLAMCSPDDGDAAAEGESGARSGLTLPWPTAAVLIMAAMLTWLIG